MATRCDASLAVVCAPVAAHRQAELLLCFKGGCEILLAFIQTATAAQDDIFGHSSHHRLTQNSNRCCTRLQLVSAHCIDALKVLNLINRQPRKMSTIGSMRILSQTNLSLRTVGHLSRTLSRSAALPLVAANTHTPVLTASRRSLHRGRRYGTVDPQAESAVNNLLYNTGPAQRQPSSRRTLCALVSNESGVLSRVAGCLAGRGFNIDSLVVSETETPGLSRMTIVLNGSDMDQARKQLEDLVQVWAVVEFSPFAAVVERELLLVKLNILPSNNPQFKSQAGSADSSSPQQQVSISSASGDSQAPSHAFYTQGYPLSSSDALSSHVQRQAIVELCELFQGRVLDLTPSFIMIELTGKSVKIDAFIALVKPFGIRELARSGTLAMLRGQITSVQSARDKQRQKAIQQQSQTVDESQLPPG